jgi:flagellar biosynthesis/type III secretory pathway chaperone
MAITTESVQQERELVEKNIKALEEQINQLTQQLQQANTNLIASRGAILAFNRLVEVSESKPAAE